MKTDFECFNRTDFSCFWRAPVGFFSCWGMKIRIREWLFLWMSFKKKAFYTLQFTKYLNINCTERFIHFPWKVHHSEVKTNCLKSYHVRFHYNCINLFIFIIMALVGMWRLLREMWYNAFLGKSSNYTERIRKMKFPYLRSKNILFSLWN